jgi:hypothetical protein
MMLMHTVLLLHEGVVLDLSRSSQTCDLALHTRLAHHSLLFLVATLCARTCAEPGRVEGDSDAFSRWRWRASGP